MAYRILLLPKGRKQKSWCFFLSRVLLLGADLDGLDNHNVDLAPGTAADGTSTAAAAVASTAAAAGTSTAAATAAAVREAIKTHASQIYTKDIKWGGTLLHWATEKPTIEAFIGKGDLASESRPESALIWLPWILIRIQ
jgi:hypothetical protein